jgi:8-oxo-dGTP diphosphatase
MYKQFASGYLVHEGKVLLVHNKSNNKWVPPGGHLENDETPDQAVIREVKEETSLDVEIISAYPSAFSGDNNSTPIPMPFHLDVVREDFDSPRIGYYFYVRTKGNPEKIILLDSEAYSFGWFSESEINNLKTYNQVKALAKFVLRNYPT